MKLEIRRVENARLTECKTIESIGIASCDS